MGISHGKKTVVRRHEKKIREDTFEVAIRRLGEERQEGDVGEGDSGKETREK